MARAQRRLSLQFKLALAIAKLESLIPIASPAGAT
jgi:hypothetical protein